MPASASRRPARPARVSAAGRVTIPKPVRDALGIDAGSDVEFEITGEGEVVLRAAPPLRGLLRAFATTPAPSASEIEAGIGDAVGRLDAATRASARDGG